MDNYMKEVRGVRMQSLICERQVGVDLSTDLSLPDYLPEIKRLLRVRAVVSPADKYVGVGSAEFSGKVDFCVLYAGNDGALYSVTQTEDYQFNVPVEMTSDFEIGDGVLCDVETVAEMTTGRVASPRKLSLRCKLRADVCIYGTRMLEENVDAHADGEVERLCGSAECARVFTGYGEPLALADEILFDSQWADLRVISAEGQVFVAEAVAGSGCVNCRGEIYLKLLYCHENSTDAPAVQLRKLPFAQSIPVDGCEVNCDACAHGVCNEIHVTVEEGRVLCDVTAQIVARAQRNETVCFTRDLYSTSYENENRYADMVLPQALKCTNGNFSLNTTMTLEEAGIRAGMNVLDISMLPGIVSMEQGHGKYYLTGRCRCHMILSDGDDMSAQEIEVPFRYEIDGAMGEMTDYDAVVDPVSCRARVDGERIAIDAELAVCVAVRGEMRAKMLSESHFGEAIKRMSSVYTVCYPAKSDTLWSVAKRYHRPIDSVSAMNSLPGSASADSADSLAGVAYLLV